MRHARYECPSATLRRTLKRRSRSMYEASGFSVTSASSAFSAAAAASCASCKPAPLCSDGCGALAVRSMCGSCDQFSASARAMRLCARPPHRPRPYRQERPRVHVARALARERAHQGNAGNTRRHMTDGMQQTTRSIHTPAIPGVADDARSMPCNELRRDKCGAAELCHHDKRHT
jgi:hypothetical protein